MRTSVLEKQLLKRVSGIIEWKITATFSVFILVVFLQSRKTIFLICNIRRYFSCRVENYFIFITIVSDYFSLSVLFFCKGFIYKICYLRAKYIRCVMFQALRVLEIDVNQIGLINQLDRVN